MHLDPGADHSCFANTSDGDHHTSDSDSSDSPSDASSTSPT